MEDFMLLIDKQKKFDNIGHPDHVLSAIKLVNSIWRAKAKKEMFVKLSIEFAH